MYFELQHIPLWKYVAVHVTLKRLNRLEVSSATNG